MLHMLMVGIDFSHFCGAVVLQLVISKEIQDLVGVMLEMLKFLTEMMSKLAPALKKLQGYLTTIEDLNLVANQEFRSVSSRISF